MIHLTDTDGDIVRIKEEHISFIYVYRNVPEPGVVQQRFKNPPKSVVHTVTGAAIAVLETADVVEDKLRGFPTSDQF